MAKSMRLGGGGKFLLGEKAAGGMARAASIEEIAKAALKAGTIGGSIAGGSQLAGSSLMGAPEDDEQGSPYSTRGAVGGGLLGGLGGGVLGGMLAAGKMGEGGALGALGSKIGAEIPDNIALQYMRKLGSAPTREGIFAGSALGATALGVPAAFLGGDEGLSLDAMRNEMQERDRKKMQERLAQSQMMAGY